jgi:hypothetical protein
MVAIKASRVILSSLAQPLSISNSHLSTCVGDPLESQRMSGSEKCVESLCGRCSDDDHDLDCGEDQRLLS